MSEEKQSNDLVYWFSLWENTSQAQHKYLSGNVGGLRVLIFRSKNPKPDGPHFNVYVTQKPERKDDAAGNGKEDEGFL